jgi:peptidoglycan-associated lipoprotein
MSPAANRLFVSAVLGLAFAVSPGCVTNKLFRSTVEGQDKKITDVQTGVEENEHRVGDLKDETRKEVARLDAKADAAKDSATAAMTKAEEAEKLARGKVLWEVTLKDDQVRFGFNQTDIPPSAAGPLDELAAKVKALDKTVYIEIEGHTDGLGSDEYNQQVGLKRAEAVREYLNEKGGLPLHLISVISYGKSRPVADNATKAGRAENRRVVIKVLE